MKEITLKEFLRHHKAGRGLFIFAKDLSLEQFLNTCENGDWILWLFARTNTISMQEFTLANAHCANTWRHLMTDERSTKAVDVAIAFGEGRATYKELENAGKAARDASRDAASGAFDAFDAASCAGVIASTPILLKDANFEFGRIAAYVVKNYDYKYDYAAEKQNQKLTADICRKYLPLEIWDQNLI